VCGIEGHCLHDGSTASLEEMFDPDRLKEAHVPGEWRPLFGLNLKPTEREQLIAFLQTL